MLTHTLFNTPDSKTSSLSEIASREKPLEPKMLPMLNAQSWNITWNNFWKDKSAMPFMMDTPTCHSTSLTPTPLTSSICGTMSQLPGTTGYQAMVNSHHSTSQDKCPPIFLKVQNTLLSNKLMDLHTNTSTQSMTHWSATNTFLKKELISKLLKTTTRKDTLLCDLCENKVNSLKNKR